MTRGAGLVLTTTAGTSHHGRAVGARPLADVSSFYGLRDDQNQRATARASGKPKRCASSPETESAGAPALSNTRRWLGVFKTTTGTSHHGRAVGARPLADIASFRRVNDNHTLRGTARVSGELECCASLLETVRCVTRGAGLGLEAAAGTSYYGHAPMKRNLSSVQSIVKVHKPIESNATRRAYGKKEC